MSSSKRWAGKLRHKSPCAKAGASSMGPLAVLAIATLSIATAFGGNSDCPACKRISSSNSMGPDWAGLYHLQDTGDMRCEMDGCLYRKGNSLFCFAPGNEEILSCDSTGEHCDTVDGPQAHLPCIFPFNFQGVAHNACTTIDGDRAWCATNVTASGDLANGNAWGYCGPGCFDVQGVSPGAEVETHTYGPVAPSASDLQVRCGVRREVGACLERVRIVGGNEAGCNEWPWQVGLLSRNGWEINSDPICGGALVNSRHIVTAAHCTHGKTVADIAVTIGDHNITATAMEPEQTWAGVEKIIEHFGYDGNVLNDIAILRLAQEVDLSLFSPVCIPPATVASSEEFAGQNATAVGWGALEYGTGDYPESLQELQDLLPIVAKADCVDDQFIYEDDLHPGMFCAGGPGLGIDTCQGDSGGPLTRQTSTGRYELVGAVSWGRNCAKSYGVYADLPYYRQWLVDNVGAVYVA